jgi:hypothetical protein
VLSFIVSRFLKWTVFSTLIRPAIRLARLLPPPWQVPVGAALAMIIGLLVARLGLEVMLFLERRQSRVPLPATRGGQPLVFDLWELTKAPIRLGMLGYFGYVGFVVYQDTLDFPKDPLSASTTSLVLLFVIAPLFLAWNHYRSARGRVELTESELIFVAPGHEGARHRIAWSDVATLRRGRLRGLQRIIAPAALGPVIIVDRLGREIVSMRTRVFPRAREIERRLEERAGPIHPA